MANRTVTASRTNPSKSLKKTWTRQTSYMNIADTSSLDLSVAMPARSLSVDCGLTLVS